MRLRKVLLVTFMAVAVPVGAGSLAYACTALAALTFTTPSAAPGQTVNGTGRGFNGGGHGTPAGTTPVELKFNTRSGTILATAAPLDAAGNISFSFVVPNAAPGSYVIIGVQTNPANGTPFYGTPARQSLRITAATGTRTSESEASAAPAPAPSADAETATATAAADRATAPRGHAASSAGAVARQTGADASSPAAVTSSAAPVQASDAANASGGVVPAAAAGGPSVAATATSAATALAPAASADPASPVTTSTPGLVSSTAPEPRSIVPALLLILLGLGIGLTATARWATSRLPQLRGRWATAA